MRGGRGMENPLTKEIVCVQVKWNGETRFIQPKYFGEISAPFWVYIYSKSILVIPVAGWRIKELKR